MVDLPLPQRHFLLLFDPSMEDFLERHFLLLLGKSDIEIAGELGQNFLTRILKNFFTKKCFHGSSDDPHKIWGQCNISPRFLSMHSKWYSQIFVLAPLS